ncbi:MAG: DUF2608 domain-containing protein [Rickettsia endosymbiont of Bryobia graminum]|nr:DUF2608 domain-containing protein [Rickettsia endosymbiont of Bryobia graminum]
MSLHKFSKIDKVSDFLQISDAVSNACQNSLVLFDIDDVLIMDQDEYRLTHPYRHQWRLEAKKRLTRAERHHLASIIFEKRLVRLVDPYISEILNLLWDRKIPTMALTKLYTGKFGVIEDFTDWRLNELKSMNIDFSKSTPIMDEMLITEAELNIGGGMPTVKEGVILTADVNKGKVLENILHKKKYYPKKIIFVDDILENLEDVSIICSNLKIDFHGFEYKGASLVPELELDHESEKIRFEILEKEYRWVPNLKLTR